MIIDGRYDAGRDRTVRWLADDLVKEHERSETGRKSGMSNISGSSSNHNSDRAVQNRNPNRQVELDYRHLSLM